MPLCVPDGRTPFIPSSNTKPLELGNRFKGFSLLKGPVPERPAGGGPLRTSPPVRTVPIPDRGAPWGSRREACKLRSHPHPSRPSVVPPSPLEGGRLWRAAPTTVTEAFPSFSQGADTGRPAGGAHPSPTVLKKLFLDWVGEPLGAPARIRTGAFARPSQALMRNRTSSNFCKPRAQRPRRNRGGHSDFARRKFCRTSQEGPS